MRFINSSGEGYNERLVMVVMEFGKNAFMCLSNFYKTILEIIA